MKSGKAFWTFRYTLHGVRTRISLGSTEHISLEKARSAAIDLSAGLTKGVDPATSLNRTKGGMTVGELCRAAIDSLDLRPATRQNWNGHLKRDIEPISGIPASRLTREQIKTWSRKIAQRSGYSSNRAFELLRRAMSFGVEEGFLEATPFVRLPKPFKAEARRERVLSPEELRWIMLALKALPCGHSDATELMLLTGCRKSAVIGGRLCEIQGDIWTIPAERQKAGVSHQVPLSPQAKAVIERIRVYADDFMFPALRSDSERPFSWIGSKYLSRLQAKVNELAQRQLEPWSFHTFRHTIATWLVENGMSEAAPGVLSHTSNLPVATRIYTHSAQIKLRGQALNAWGEYLQGLCAPPSDPS